jgi:putative phage-type endonuclease
MNAAEKAAWLDCRAGKLTASRMRDAMDFLKTGKESEARKRYKMDLLAERLTGDSVPHYVNDLMKWGLEQEPFAKAAFECATGQFIRDCGFIDHPEIDLFGATPDGLLLDAVVEFKCPQTTTHLGWILDGKVPEQHRPQILAQMACTRYRKAVFVSFDPRVKREDKRLFIKEWTPELEEIIAIENHARVFLEEVEAMFRILTES